jgi:hypothetical protein
MKVQTAKMKAVANGKVIENSSGAAVKDKRTDGDAGALMRV